MAQKKVLVTGMSGLIGGLVRDRIEGKYTLSALNRRPVEGVECHLADIADLEAIRPAFEGVDVVVHLAAMAQPSGMTWEELLSANIVGCYNVFEASRQAGVKRIVFASSGATVRNWDRVFPYNAIVEGRYDEVPETWKKGGSRNADVARRTLWMFQSFRRGVGETFYGHLRHLDNQSTHRRGHPRKSPNRYAWFLRLVQPA